MSEYEVGDFVCKSSGFATSGTGKDQRTCIDLDSCVVLFGVEILLEKCGDVLVHGRKRSFIYKKKALSAFVIKIYRDSL